MRGSRFFVEKTTWKWSERWVDGIAAVSGAPAGARAHPYRNPVARATG
jgi:hypothetical protein